MSDIPQQDVPEKETETAEPAPQKPRLWHKNRKKPKPAKEDIDAQVKQLDEKLRSSRATKSGYRKGAHRFAAPLGCFVMFLSLAGVAFLVFAGVWFFRSATDDTALRTELFDFVAPVAQYQPTPFEDISQSDQNAFVMAAIYRITEAERVRMLQQKTDEYSYPVDTLGRLLIPVAEVDASYAYLFGPDAAPIHRTMGGEAGFSSTFEYDAKGALYHVPAFSSPSMYTNMVRDFKRKGDTAEITIGYALITELQIDDKGNEIPPSPEQSVFFQTFVVQQTDSGWKLIAVRAA